jgi:hypothetical protein
MTENSFEIPQTMSDCAEQNVKQANAAYKQPTDFVNKSVALGAMPSVGFKDLQDRAMDFALENSESACTFAGQVSNAKTTQEILTPAHVVLNDAPATGKAYDTAERAKGCLAQARTLVGRAKQDAICTGMGALRRTVEEAVVKKLLKNVVPRWSDRVIVTGLRNVAWDDGLVEDLCSIYEELSKYIEGHSHTDEATGAPPEIKDLEQMIIRVETLIKRAKQDRKKVQQSAAA